MIFGGDLWGRSERGRSYKEVPYDALPALVTPPMFAWLRDAPIRGEREQLKLETDANDVNAIVEVAKEEGLTVPSSYVAFMNDESLHKRIPTCTNCYLSVPTNLIDAPEGHEGKLLRFLNDQQNAVIWYLHLKQDGSHKVVCAQPADDEDDDDDDDEAQPGEVVVCAQSFEELVHRFWIENTIWFALYERTKAPLTPEQEAYVTAAKSAPARRLLNEQLG